MAERIPQSVTIRVPLQAYLSSDHVTPATGKTIAITISKNGATYANPSGGATNAVEVGFGSYYVDMSTTDTGTVGPLCVKGAEGTIDQIISFYDVAAFNAAAPTANQNADALLDRADAIETGLTPRQAMRLMAADSAGKVSGAGTATNIFRNAVADSKPRITATVDVDGNRTAITTDVT